MAIDFPTAPALNQLFVAPNGVAYIWDGAVWRVENTPSSSKWSVPTAFELAPLDTAKTVVRFGASGSRGRVRSTTGPTMEMSMNRSPSDTADDPAKAAWLAQLSNLSEEFTVLRAPPTTGTLAWASLFAVAQAGHATVSRHINSMWRMCWKKATGSVTLNPETDTSIPLDQTVFDNFVMGYPNGINFPADSVVFVGASIGIQAAGMTVWIDQQGPGGWKHRAGMTHGGTSLATVYNVHALC